MAATEPTIVRTPDELDQLVGPIALYPDALLAIMLPASTKPVDIVMAIRYLQEGRSLSAIEQQPWDDSVRALAHHREALEFLDENLLWTRELAEVFTNQPADLMASIQRLRRAALNAGTLKDTPEHKLIVTADEIRIVPADPERIYIPRYDSRVVYVERPAYYSSPAITFGVGFSVGSWLNYDCDWRHRRIYVIDRSWLWHSSPTWRLHRFHYGPRYETHYWRPWTHSHRYHRPVHVAPVYPRHHTRPSHYTPRFDDSRRDRHDRRDDDRRHDDRRDRYTPRFDDARRRTDLDRRYLTPRVTPQAATPTPVVTQGFDRNRRVNAERRTPRITPQNITPTPVAAAPTPTPRQFNAPANNRRPDFNRANAPRVAPGTRRSEHVVPRVANVERPAPRVHTPAPAPRVHVPAPAQHRPAPRAESRQERSDRNDRSDSGSANRTYGNNRPNRAHLN